MTKTTKTTKATTPSHGIRRQTIKNLNQYIDDTIAQSKKVEGRLHNAAFACVERVGANGDVRPMNRLLDGVGKRSIRRNAMQAYFQAVAPVIFNEETKQLEADATKKNKDNTYTVDLGKAWDKPFWDYKAMEGTDKPFDLEKLIGSLAARTAKRVLDPQEKDKLPANYVKVLRQLAPKVFKEIEDAAKKAEGVKAVKPKVVKVAKTIKVSKKKVA